MIIAIDFDGTIFEHSYPEVGKLMPYAAEVISALKARGNEIIIWTCRSEKTADLAVEALKKHNIPYDKFNEHIDRVIDEFGNDVRKIFANVYVDDRNLGGLPPWPAIFDLLVKQHGA